MFTNRAWHVDAVACDLTEQPLDDDLVREGTPTTRVRDLVASTRCPVEIGIWEHTAGASVDVEVDEVFVVVSGRATVTYSDGTSFEVGPGSVVATPDGLASTWTVHDDLRKVYVIGSDRVSGAPPTEHLSGREVVT